MLWQVIGVLQISGPKLTEKKLASARRNQILMRLEAQ